jgi:hypothetical protein
MILSEQSGSKDSSKIHTRIFRQLEFEDHSLGFYFKAKLNLVRRLKPGLLRLATKIAYPLEYVNACVFRSRKVALLL